jgi:hypothetical protein
VGLCHNYIEVILLFFFFGLGGGGGGGGGGVAHGESRYVKFELPMLKCHFLFGRPKWVGLCHNYIEVILLLFFFFGLGGGGARGKQVCEI